LTVSDIDVLVAVMCNHVQYSVGLLCMSATFLVWTLTGWLT